MLVLWYFKVSFELSQLFPYCTCTERAEFGNGSVNCRFKGLHGNGTHAIVVTGYWILFMLTLLHVRLSWFLNVIVLVNIIEIKNLQMFTEK